MAGMADTLKQFVEDNIKQIVDKPDDVKVTSTVSTKAIILQIQVSQSDCGKIIGKQGRTIGALKVLCLANKNTKYPNDSRRVMLEVLEDENSGFTYK